MAKVMISERNGMAMGSPSGSGGPATPPQRPPSPQHHRSCFKTPIPLSDHPAIPCPRCRSICAARLSRSPRNPFRTYYTCPRSIDGKCKFFKWCDEIIGDWDRVLPFKDRPECDCHAGTSMLVLEHPDHPNLPPTYYLVCPIAKGHGACQFRLDVDEFRAAMAMDLNGGEDDLGLDLENWKNRKFEQRPSSFACAPLTTAEDVEETLICSEENVYTSKLLTFQDMVPQEGELMVEKALQLSSLTSLAFHHRQTEFWRQICAAGDATIADPLSQFLGRQVLGWLGRIMFPPSGCLTDPPSMPFFCRIYPSYNPIVVPKHVDVVPMNTQSDCLDLSTRNGLGIEQQQADGDKQDFEALGKMVLLCQNHLLSHLESMNPVDVETMKAVSERHFGVVNHLLANHMSFSERVRRFVACASSLSEIETSIKMDASMQELIERYQVEKLRYDNLCLSHSQTVDAIAASDQQLEQLHKEALRLKEMLVIIENQMMDGEVENRRLKRQAIEMSKEVLESQKKMKGASEEVEAANKVAEEREAARRAAKAALEEARNQLRQGKL